MTSVSNRVDAPRANAVRYQSAPSSRSIETTSLDPSPYFLATAILLFVDRHDCDCPAKLISSWWKYPCTFSIVSQDCEQEHTSIWQTLATSSHWPVRTWWTGPDCLLFPHISRLHWWIHGHQSLCLCTSNWSSCLIAGKFQREIEWFSDRISSSFQVSLPAGATVKIDVQILLACPRINTDGQINLLEKTQCHIFLTTVSPNVDHTLKALRKPWVTLHSLFPPSPNLTTTFPVTLLLPFSMLSQQGDQKPLCKCSSWLRLGSNDPSSRNEIPLILLWWRQHLCQTFYFPTQLGMVQFASLRFCLESTEMVYRPENSRIDCVVTSLRACGTDKED